MTVFFDSNVVIYTLTKDDPRQPVATRLVAAGGKVSVQVLNEFASVAHRKLKLKWADVIVALEAVRSLVDTPVSITLDVHVEALDLARRHNFSFYDALIVAAALSVGSTTLYSEDMGDGMIVRGTLKIVDPFKPTN